MGTAQIGSGIWDKGKVSDVHAQILDSVPDLKRR